MATLDQPCRNVGLPGSSLQSFAFGVLEPGSRNPKLANELRNFTCSMGFVGFIFKIGEILGFRLRHGRIFCGFGPGLFMLKALKLLVAKHSTLEPSYVSPKSPNPKLQKP